MKPSCVLVALASSGVCGQGADPPGHEFIAPGPEDVRSPCPWMNALANHAYLPRSGRNITQQDLINQFEEALNFAPGVLDDVAAGVVSTGTRGDGTFDLPDSARHGVVEHDASLSRADTFFGDAGVFNPIIWAAVRKSFVNPTISIDEAARARSVRIAEARASNPQFNLSDAAVMGTFAESSLYLLLFGDSRVDGNANTLFVRTVFEQERLPFQEGFVKPAEPIIGDQVVAMVGRLQASTPP